MSAFMNGFCVVANDFMVGFFFAESDRSIMFTLKSLPSVCENRFEVFAAGNVVSDFNFNDWLNRPILNQLMYSTYFLKGWLFIV